MAAVGSSRLAVGRRHQQRAIRALISSVVICGVLSLQSCRGPEQPYVPLAQHAEALRQQFNGDAGKTRIMILPAPN